MWKRLPRPASSICKEIREETVMPNLVLRLSSTKNEEKQEKVYMTGIIFLERLLTDTYYVTSSAKREVTAEQALWRAKVILKFSCFYRINAVFKIFDVCKRWRWFSWYMWCCSVWPRRSQTSINIQWFGASWKGSSGGELILISKVVNLELLTRSLKAFCTRTTELVIVFGW